MPHLIVEYSNTLQPSMQTVLPTLHQVLLASNQFGAPDIKVRTRKYQDFLVGGTADVAFVHLTLYLLDGRSHETKHALSQALCAAVQQHIQTSLPIQITVDIRDMVRATYSKIIK